MVQVAAIPRDELDDLIEQHQLDVTRTVRRLLGWRGNVDDVVQEVFVAALKHREKFRREASVKTWLIGIAIRQCRKERLRWWKWRKRSEYFDPVMSADGGPRGLPSAAEETAEEVRDAVRKLPQKEREVVVLYYLEELSTAEVAKLTGISTSAVDVRLHRARKKLAEMLKENV